MNNKQPYENSEGIAFPTEETIYASHRKWVWAGVQGREKARMVWAQERGAEGTQQIRIQGSLGHLLIPFRQVKTLDITGEWQT